MSDTDYPFLFNMKPLIPGGPTMFYTMFQGNKDKLDTFLGKPKSENFLQRIKSFKMFKPMIFQLAVNFETSSVSTKSSTKI